MNKIKLVRLKKEIKTRTKEEAFRFLIKKVKNPYGH